MVRLRETETLGWLGGSIIGVVSDKPDAPGLDKAQELGIEEVHALPRLKDEAREAYDERLVHLVSSMKPDVIALAGFMRILTPTFVDAFANKIVNIHPSLLPKHKGAHGVRDTLEAGDSEAGCTAHLVTAELDGGPHILQAKLDVHDQDTLESLQARVLEMEHQIFPRAIDLVARGDVQVREGSLHITGTSPSWRQHLPLKPEWSFPDAF